MAKIKSYIHIALLLCIGLALGSCTKWNYHDGGVAYGVHDCSMWDYFKKQPRDWDSTRVMIGKTHHSATHPDERRTPWFPFRGYRREDRRQDLHPDGRK